MSSGEEGQRSNSQFTGSAGDGADAGPPHLSVIVPAYNEEERLPTTLDAIRQYLCRQPYTWEVIVVDDGSDDDTTRVAVEVAGESDWCHVVRQRHQGKAAAVRTGVDASVGANVLFTDADLSTPIDAVELLLAEREKGFDIAIGSREGTSARRIDEPGYRHLMGRAFNWVVRLVAVRGIKDTQCGFKLLSRKAADRVFPKLLVNQSGVIVNGPRVSAFDVELLFVAQREGYRIAEVPVVWTHARGSKVRPALDSVRMFIDVLNVRWNALRGKYN